MANEQEKPAVPVIKEGVPVVLTEEQKEALRKQNEEESKRATVLAQEQIRRDIESGKTPGIAGALTDVAGLIKGKLERDEFSVVVDDETGQHIPARPAEKE